jgi:hypothetical protein
MIHLQLEAQEYKLYSVRPKEEKQNAKRREEIDG